MDKEHDWEGGQLAASCWRKALERAKDLSNSLIYSTCNSYLCLGFFSAINAAGKANSNLYLIMITSKQTSFRS